MLIVEWDQGFSSFIPQTFTERLTQAKDYSSSLRNFAREPENLCPEAGMTCMTVIPTLVR